ncbi:kinase-like domain-containing protein [Lentinula aff. detonsa]|uniref:Kinase-like domain-containing protein n=1 Tax=Lentinula aff. detonsa TaxID=2804958 RepID=A0AA38KD65_9AGAR|nr:kinase-like domain-containing protein [Lentinula aff. detonsa]
MFHAITAMALTMAFTMAFTMYWYHTMTTLANDSDNSICINPERPAFSCQRSLPFKDYAGPCARCLHISRVQNPEELKRDASAPSCEGCGAIVMFMLSTAKFCGTFLPAGPVTATKELQAKKQAARSDAMANCILSKAVPTTAAAAAVQSSAPVAPRTQVWQKLGVASGNFQETQSFSECLNELIAHWNVRWEKSSRESLSVEFVEIRLYGNIALRPGSDLQTIGHLHDVHESILPEERLKRCPTTTRPPKGPFVYLEGFISFEIVTGAAAPDWIKTEKELKKRETLSACLKSTFVPQLPPGTTKVSLLFGKFIFNKNSKCSTIDYPAPFEENLVTGYLSDHEFDSGHTKKVYKLLINNQEWVAKRFHDNGNVSDTVLVQENRFEVEAEGQQLHQLHDILNAFMEHAKKNKVKIAADIRVTEFKIALEIPENHPSPASGITAGEINALKPTKWSGTMQHPEHNSKVGNTLTSFVHFAYEWTHQTVVFADLQTSKVGSENGGTNILFDPMSHTLGGNSGVGDHGNTGIQQFLRSHHCEKRCRELGLKTIGMGSHLSHTEQLDDSGEDSEEDEGNAGE